MSYPNLSIFLIAVIFVCFARASESKDAALEQSHYSGKQSQEWEKIQAQLAAQKTKLDAQEAIVKALAAEKAGLSGEKLTAKTEELKAAYAKLGTMTSDYNKINEDYLTRFPERGLKDKRVYTRIRPRTLKSYEDDTSVRGRVNSVHKKILKQYAKPQATPENKKSTPEKTEAADSSVNSAPDVTAPIQIKQ